MPKVRHIRTLWIRSLRNFEWEFCLEQVNKTHKLCTNTCETMIFCKHLYQSTVKIDEIWCDYQLLNTFRISLAFKRRCRFHNCIWYTLEGYNDVFVWCFTLVIYKFISKRECFLLCCFCMRWNLLRRAFCFFEIINFHNSQFQRDNFCFMKFCIYLFNSSLRYCFIFFQSLPNVWKIFTHKSWNSIYNSKEKFNFNRLEPALFKGNWRCVLYF